MEETPGGKGLRDAVNPPFATIRPVPGEEAIRPQEDAPPRPPLAVSGISGNSFAGDAKGLRVGRAWHDRGTDGGRVAPVEPVPTGAYWNRPIFKDPF